MTVAIVGLPTHPKHFDVEPRNYTDKAEQRRRSKGLLNFREWSKSEQQPSCADAKQGTPLQILQKPQNQLPPPPPSPPQPLCGFQGDEAPLSEASYDDAITTVEEQLELVEKWFLNQSDTTGTPNMYDTTRCPLTKRGMINLPREPSTVNEETLDTKDDSGCQSLSSDAMGRADPLSNS